jgi:hypothetical protein
MVVLTLMLLSMSLSAEAGIVVVISAVLSLDTVRILWGSRKEGGRLGINFFNRVHSQHAFRLKHISLRTIGAKHYMILFRQAKQYYSRYGVYIVGLRLKVETLTLSLRLLFSIH